MAIRALYVFLKSGALDEATLKACVRLTKVPLDFTGDSDENKNLLSYSCGIVLFGKFGSVWSEWQ